MTLSGYSEDTLVVINPDSLDVRVDDGLMSGLRDWHENTLETLRLTTRHQGGLALNIPQEAGA